MVPVKIFLFFLFFLFKEMIPCLSFLSPLWFSPRHDVALMVAVTKYRADEWLMRPWPARQKISFSLAQRELTRRQTEGKKPTERISKCLSDQLIPESILGKLASRQTFWTWHTPAADWRLHLYKQEAGIISVAEASRGRFSQHSLDNYSPLVRQRETV